MIEAYKKVHKFCMVISYFATQEWKIQTDKVLQQQKNLGEKDKKIFFSDLLDLDWDEYFEAYCTGARVHLLRDPIDNLETALIKWKRYLFFKKKNIPDTLLQLLLFQTILCSYDCENATLCRCGLV